ncbi:S8 family peptidase [Leptospira kmetyi]|uniref:Peptidase S8/S53 domain-containing protein n=1 Tax=Leptospira kmetyi TaxID=408139 RepID=A0ABX4N4S2_9LEPT|nr:S8 family peptidase [Leptospira kmetyi]PJZ28393.1 hypothetical protein CH378_18120 [Leptospira kmetyi]
MNTKNLLLGHGETLTYDISKSGKPNNKNHPYKFEDVQSNLVSDTKIIISKINDLQFNAKPNGKSVIKVILHPAYLAKSYYPSDLLNQFSLSDIGSKSIAIVPRKQIAKKKTDKIIAPCLFVSGKEQDFKDLLETLESVDGEQKIVNEFIKLETLEYYNPLEKIKTAQTWRVDNKVEVVIHQPENENNIIELFYEYAQANNVKMDMDKRVKTKGLVFIPAICDEKGAAKLSEFTYLRALRVMPYLRTSKPIIRHISSSPTPIKFPQSDAINTDLKVAVFDGGIGNNKIDRWCTETIFQSAKTDPEYLIHGSEVTSTILFGNLANKQIQLPTPYCKVDHFRVIDSENDSDPDLYDVLKRISDILDKDKYQYVNLSLGPKIPIEDDEVNVWTSKLESYLSSGETLLTVAVGNDGELGDQNRIQPPADLVNGLSVGAADRSSEKWKRASYSCVGPGRSPGLVKPDAIAFGGSELEPFLVYSPINNTVIGTAGTSFASPLTLRTAIGIHTFLDYPLTPLTVKALLIHRIEPSNDPRSEIGWGRINTNIDKFLQCEDNEATVIYQGVLSPTKYAIVPIAFPQTELKGSVFITATFCFSSDYDPEHPHNYTKSGLTITFVPKGNIKNKTKTFFNLKNHFSTEDELRADSHKWETTLHHEQRFKKDTLSDPFFKIDYQSREKGAPQVSKLREELKYSLIVTIKVKDTPEVYNAILQRYQTLVPIKLKQSVQIKA